MPIKVATTEQTCAFGAAMFAAVVGGVYSKVEEAQKAMGKGFEKEYLPDSAKAKKYAEIYKKYESLGAFINENR
jgi:L-ribulokinase